MRYGFNNGIWMPKLVSAFTILFLLDSCLALSCLQWVIIANISQKIQIGQLVL